MSGFLLLIQMYTIYRIHLNCSENYHIVIFRTVSGFEQKGYKNSFFVTVTMSLKLFN